jgi:hypothetical protein
MEDTNPKPDWICSRCGPLLGREVTYEEKCDYCGGDVLPIQDFASPASRIIELEKRVEQLESFLQHREDCMIFPCMLIELGIEPLKLRRREMDAKGDN